MLPILIFCFVCLLSGHMCEKSGRVSVALSLNDKAETQELFTFPLSPWSFCLVVELLDTVPLSTGNNHVACYTTSFERFATLTAVSTNAYRRSEGAAACTATTMHAVHRLTRG